MGIKIHSGSLSKKGGDGNDQLQYGSTGRDIMMIFRGIIIFFFFFWGGGVRLVFFHTFNVDVYVY